MSAKHSPNLPGLKASSPLSEGLGPGSLPFGLFTLMHAPKEMKLAKATLERFFQAPHAAVPTFTPAMLVR